ncbi:unnamed protein product [Ranitomeya imitator]|uniref:Talin 2 n=1 Tax=Ranitomeya imitator TaxID=111125 RepID=A0ABN9LAV4_9NEOB|nr:unnamed protein product [Ranitomeya imitator]
MFTLVTGDLGIVGRWRAVCVTALQRPNSDAAAIRIVVGIAAASLCVTVAKAVSHSLNNCVNCLPGQKDVDMALKSIGESSKKLLVESLPPSTKSFQEAQSGLNQAAEGLNQSAGEVVHASRGQSGELAAASGKFSEDFDEFLDAGIEMAGQTQADESLSIVLDTLARFGWLVIRKKSCLIPSQCLFFLGMLFDTRQTRVFLPEDKRSTLRQEVRLLQGPQVPSFRSAMKNKDDQMQVIGNLKTISMASSKLLLAAKSLSVDSGAPSAKNLLAAAARAVTESINQLITICTQQAPGQKECDNALRELEVCYSILALDIPPTVLVYFHDPYLKGYNCP